jgi:hypothetical protein
MWTFQGPRAVRIPSAEDSFIRALNELDRTPPTYAPNGRNRISGLSGSEDDLHSHTSSYVNLPPTWGSGDTASTLKATDSDGGTDDAEKEKTPQPPAAVDFWSPSLKETRWTVLKKYSWTCKSGRVYGDYADS